MRWRSMKKASNFLTFAPREAEAAKSLADMARDAIHTSASSKRHHMAIEVRDAGGPIMQVRFTFEIQRLKH